MSSLWFIRFLASSANSVHLILAVNVIIMVWAFLCKQSYDILTVFLSKLQISKALEVIRYLFNELLIIYHDQQELPDDGGVKTSSSH